MGKGVRIAPSTFISTLGSFIEECHSKNLKPQVASRSTRDVLRLGHGETIAVLPVALQTVRKVYGIPSMVETIQYASVRVLEAMTKHPVAKDCIKAYDESLDRAKVSPLFRDIRDKGCSYSVNPKAERSMSFWAFNEKTADEIEGLSGKFGLYCGHSFQIFLCLVLSTCEDALEKEQITELRQEALRGLVRIALYSHDLNFDEKVVVI